MTKRAFWSGIVASVLALSAAGCGGTKSCKELCEATNECPDVIPSDTPCEDQCEARDTLVKAAKCEAEQQAFDECVSKLPDVCDANTECNTTGQKIYFCIDDYCMANPSACGGS